MTIDASPVSYVIPKCLQVGKEMISCTLKGSAMGFALASLIVSSGTAACQFAGQPTDDIQTREIMVLTTVGLGMTGLFIGAVRGLVEVFPRHG